MDRHAAAALTVAVLGAMLLSAVAHAHDALAREVLRNAEFVSSWTSSGRVRLRDGRFREPAAPGSATEIQVWLLDHLARWRWNGRAYAAVILATDPGGSGTFYELIVVEARGGRPVQVASVELGDRVRVQSLAMARGTESPAIRVDLIVHGPHDALCCPTRQAVRRFTWRAGTLAASD